MLPDGARTVAAVELMHRESAPADRLRDRYEPTTLEVGVYVVIKVVTGDAKVFDVVPSKLTMLKPSTVLPDPSSAVKVYVSNKANASA